MVKVRPPSKSKVKINHMKENCVRNEKKAFTQGNANTILLLLFLL